MSIRKTIAVVALALIASPLAAQEAGEANAGAAKTAGGGMAPLEKHASEPIMPKVISTYGDEIDVMFWGIFWLTAIVGAIVLGLMLVFLILYRHREGRTTAIHTHGSHKLEYIWTIATALILVFLAFWQQGAWSTVTAEVPEAKDSLLIRVYGEQFGWYFNYAGEDGKFEEQLPWIGSATAADPGDRLGLDDPDGDITLLNELVVPVDTNIVLELHSHGKFFAGDEDEGVEDRYIYPVLHSFFSPHLRFKRDLVPFHPGQVWFRVKPGHEGVYEIACAELCGEGHYTMRADFRVVSQADFESVMGFSLSGPKPDGFPKAYQMNDREAYEKASAGQE